MAASRARPSRQGSGCGRRCRPINPVPHQHREQGVTARLPASAPAASPSTERANTGGSHDHRSHTPAPERHLRACHQPDHRRHRGRRRPVPDALAPRRIGHHYARQRRLAQGLSWRQRHRTLGRRARRRLSRRHLGHLSPVAGARRPGPQGRARAPRRVLEDRRSPRQGRRTGRRRGSRRARPAHVRPRLHGLQLRAGRRLHAARDTGATRGRAHRAGRTVLRSARHRHPPRRIAGLLPPIHRPRADARLRLLPRCRSLLRRAAPRMRALCRKSDYAAWPSFSAVTPAFGHAAVRHNQSASRKASSSSLGRYRPGCVSGPAT